MPTIPFKTITQQHFEVDVNDTATVAEVKQKIAELKGENLFPVEGQKLIFNGKVLDDSQQIAELNVLPPKFIVVMVIQKKVTKAPTDSAQGATKDEASAVPPPPQSATPVSHNSQRDMKLDYPPEHSETISNIEAMGYPREEVIRALRAAFYNVDRAVEYLCTGIPEGLNLPNIADEQAAVAPGNGDDDGEGSGDGDDMEGGLAFLSQSPQFAQLRDMVRADPATLPQIVQQIAETNPQLMALIRNNQEEFLQLLNASIGDEGAAEGAAQAHAEGGAAGGTRRVAIPVTQVDRDAINRLKQMGFPEALVIEAYFACDRDENLAVNYILQRMEEFHNELEQGGDAE